MKYKTISIINGILIGVLLSYGTVSLAQSLWYPVSNQLVPVSNVWGVNASGTSNFSTTSIKNLTVLGVPTIGNVLTASTTAGLVYWAASAGGGVSSLNTLTGALTLWGTSPLTITASSTVGLVFAYTETDPLWTASSTNFGNWNTAYTDRLKWDGGSTGLVAATGRTSLGLGDSAVLASTTWAKIANNLSDLASTSTARTNLGLGTGNSPTFVGVNLGNTGLHLADTDASHDLVIQPLSDFTLQRTLGISTGDSDRTITLSGNPTLADWFNQSVRSTSTPTFAGLTLTGLTGFLKGTTGVIGTSTIGFTDLTGAATDAQIPNDITITGFSLASSTKWSLATKNTASINLINATGTLETMFKKQNAITLTKVSCNSKNGTTSIQLYERTEAVPNSAGAALLNAILVCSGNGLTASTTSFADSSIVSSAPVIASSTTGTAGAANTNTYIYVDYAY